MYIVRLIRAVLAALLGVSQLSDWRSRPGPGQRKAPGVPEGVYNVNIDGQATTEWEIFPVCVPTVGDLREPLLLPVACRLKVTPAGLTGGEAIMVGGQWQFVRRDRRSYLSRRQQLPRDDLPIDPNTWIGTMKVLHGGQCGDQPGMVNVPLTMSFKQPLPIPVTQYPLYCEPGGLRRCF